jgi:hypothetical protein
MPKVNRVAYKTLSVSCTPVYLMIPAKLLVIKELKRPAIVNNITPLIKL